MPVSRREWISVRKVCDSTVGSPRVERGGPGDHDPPRRRPRGVHRHDRVDAHHQVGPRLEGHRGVQRLEQDAVDVVRGRRSPPADRGRAAPPRPARRARSARGPSPGSPKRTACPSRGRSPPRPERLRELAEVVGAALESEDLLQIVADRLVVEDSRPAGPGPAASAMVEQGAVARVAGAVPHRLREQPGHRRRRAAASQRRGVRKVSGTKGCSPGSVADDRPAHLGGGEVVGQAGADEARRRSPRRRCRGR